MNGSGAWTAAIGIEALALDKDGSVCYTEVEVQRMEETISLLGVNLRCVPPNDIESLIDEYMNNGVLDTMCMVSREMLLYAGEEPSYKSILESMDLHVIVEKEIFVAAENQDEELLRKVEERRVFRDVLQIAGREKKACFLLAQNEELLDGLKEELLAICSDLSVAGSYVADNCSGDPEMIVNEINSVMPDVVLSLMDQPFQEEFLYEQKQKIGAKLWFGLVPEGILDQDKGSWLKRLIGRNMFRRKVQQYKNRQEEE